MTNPWSGIEKPTSEFNVRLVSDSHPLRLYWGVDSRGRYVFLIDASAGSMPDRRSIPELAGIKAAVGAADGRARLALVLNEVVNWELFHSLCNDLVRASAAAAEEAAAVAIVVRRLQRWQEFLRRQRPLILPLEELKGLIGELLFLTDTLAPKFGWDVAIGFWKGPEEAPQDFAVHETAVEVKCQSGSSKPWIRISSIHQLNPQLPRGYLVVHTLASADADDPGAFTINSMVLAIRSALEGHSDATRERLENLLFLAGYIATEAYDAFVFQRIATRSFRLADGFPRLAAGAVPAGIDRVTYQLKLDACAAFEAPLHL